MMWFQIFLWLLGTTSWLVSGLMALHSLHCATSIIKLTNTDRVTPVGSAYNVSN